MSKRLSSRRRPRTVLLLGILLSVPLTAAAPAAQEPGLVYPVDIVPAADGWIVADFKAPGLLRLSQDGSVTPLKLGEGIPRTPLYGTRAVIEAPDGNGWIVADPATFGLYRVDTAGDLSTITAELDIPQGLVAFDAESVLVADLRSGLGAILRVGLAGGLSVFAEVPSPKGMVAFGEDAFAVVSHGERAVYRVGRDGTVAVLASGPPFDFPHDLVADPDGSLVITDGYAAALFRVGSSGEISVLAQGAPLVSPQGIAHTPEGDYVVVDPQAGAVFRVSRDGQVAQLATLSAR